MKKTFKAFVTAGLVAFILGIALIILGIQFGASFDSVWGNNHYYGNGMFHYRIVENNISNFHI